MPAGSGPGDRVRKRDRAKIVTGSTDALCQRRKCARIVVELSLGKTGIDEPGLEGTFRLDRARSIAPGDRARAALRACRRGISIVIRGKELRESGSEHS